MRGVLYLPNMAITAATYVQRLNTLVTVCSAADGQGQPCSGILGKMIHPKFAATHIPEYNLALLKHAAKLTTRLSLDPGQIGETPQLQIRLVGWGWKKTRWQEQVELERIRLALLSPRQCQSAFPIGIHYASQVCSKHWFTNAEPNYVAEGSPLLHTKDNVTYLIGIASWYRPKIFDNALNVFSRISAASSWICNALDYTK